MQYCFTVFLLGSYKSLLDKCSQVIIVCFQEDIPQTSSSDLTDLEALGQGGFGVVYRAKHKRFGTVVYKKLNAEKLGDRYLTSCSRLIRPAF